MNRRHTVAMMVVHLCLAVPGAGRADVLSGAVSTRVRPGATPAQAVVYAEPITSAAPARAAAPFAITQKNKTFTPRVLGVPVGATVQFPNQDGLFHNVFSLTPGHAFDLGLYRGGASKSRTFSTTGVVRVFCNIHPQMTALVVVVATPWIVNAGADGAFRLDLPPGRYRVTALSERASAVSVEVAVAGATAAPALSLDESAFVAAPHSNKFGKPYPEAAYKQP
jgi:plastocyanin